MRNEFCHQGGTVSVSAGSHTGPTLRIDDAGIVAHATLSPDDARALAGLLLATADSPFFRRMRQFGEAIDAALERDE